MRINIFLKYSLPSIVFLLIFHITNIQAQFAQLRDEVYMVDESSVSVGLIEISTKKIKYKNQANKIKSVDADQILMVFNKSGEYLLYPNKTLTDQQGELFIKSTTLPPSDILITVEKHIIPTRIISKNDDEIIYENVDDPNGEQAISKDVLAAIIYKSGNHELLVSPSEAAAILASKAATITNYRNGITLAKKEYENLPLPKDREFKSRTVKNPAESVAREETKQSTQYVWKKKDENKSTSETTEKPATAVVADNTKNTSPSDPGKSKTTAVVADNAKSTSSSDPAKSETPRGQAANKNIDTKDKSTIASTTVQKESETSTPVNPATQITQSSQTTQTNQTTQIKDPVSPATASTGETQADVATSEPKIDFEQFSKKALQKTKDLGVYLSVISDKASDYQQANKAIDQAVNLFVSEDARVEVSNNNGLDYKVRFKIREYLNRLKLLKYDKVEISWSNINYVSNFRKGPDGNYYGIISLQQKFNGLMEGKVVFSDVTRKNIEVILKSYNKDVEGKSQELWDVLLSDIGIVVAKSN